MVSGLSGESNMDSRLLCSSCVQPFMDMSGSRYFRRLLTVDHGLAIEIVVPGLMMAVLIPRSFPFLSNRAPPLLPGLIVAS